VYVLNFSLPLQANVRPEFLLQTMSREEVEREAFDILVGGADPEHAKGSGDGGGTYLLKSPLKIGTSERGVRGRAHTQHPDFAIILDHTAPAGTPAPESLLVSEGAEAFVTLTCGGLFAGAGMYGGPRTASGLCANPSAGGTSCHIYACMYVCIYKYIYI
jgi:hypothetical protein